MPLTSSAQAATFGTPAAAYTGGGALHNDVRYARSGVDLTLTVKTSADTRCVQVEGVPQIQTFTPAPGTKDTKTEWTFAVPTAPSTTTDGAQLKVVTIGEDWNTDNKTGAVTGCKKGTASTGTATNPSPSYTLDNTKPGLDGAPTTQPNGNNGWYTSDVTMKWTAKDGGSGVAANPLDSTIKGEGTGLTATAKVSDRAGNESTSSSPAVKIDGTAPVTEAEAPPATDWNNIAQTVLLKAGDNLAGVAATHYQLNGGSVTTVNDPATTGTPVEISADGTHTLKFWSVDKAGNSETAQTATIKIDKTKPTINHTQAPEANPKGWNNTDVTVKFDCQDGDGSGIKSCTGVVDGVNNGVKVTTEGEKQAVTGTAVDNAGNSVEDPAKVSIDKTKPTIDVKVARPADSNGWYNKDVSVGFTYDDTLSGIASNGVASKTFDENGVGQSVEVTASDAAGNEHKDGISGIKLDKTAPTTSANAPSGWQRGPVTVTLEAADQAGLSGVARTEYSLDGKTWTEGTSVKFEIDGTHSFVFRSVDVAGNTEQAKPATVSIDASVPTITDRGPTVTTPNGANGWYTTAVENRFTAEDLVSGLADTTKAGFTMSSGDAQGAAVTIPSGSVFDVAGNENKGISSDAFKIDLTAPSITAGAAPAGANAAGWYKAAVDAPFTAEDTVSGLADASRKSFTKPTGTLEGTGVTVNSGSVADVAGNSNSGIASVPLNIDLTAPSAPTFSGIEAKTYATAPAESTITCAATDELSGFDKCSFTGYSSAAGTHTLTATASDNAGHTNTSKLTYTVASPWKLHGFYAPIGEANSFVVAAGGTAPTASSTTVWQTAKGGSAIPLKFEVFKDNVESTSTADVKGLTAQKLSSCTGTVSDAVEDLATAGSSSLTYSDGQFVQVWKTGSVSGDTCYRVAMTTTDGSAIYTFVKLRK